ncbi:MAG: type II toxin-antitoxin system prevent-host-death family antitoxin [Actinomycetota bacterium]
MRTVSVSKLKAGLAAELRRVKSGQELVITERGRPIARVSPIRDLDAEMEDMVARGIIRPGKGTIDESFWELPRGEDPTGSVLSALLEERREGR